jgi:hypothetical protein
MGGIGIGDKVSSTRPFRSFSFVDTHSEPTLCSAASRDNSESTSSTSSTTTPFCYYSSSLPEFATSNGCGSERAASGDQVFGENGHTRRVRIFDQFGPHRGRHKW